MPLSNSNYKIHPKVLVVPIHISDGHEPKVLAIRHWPSKDLTFVGGGWKSGEAFVDASEREMEEETGIPQNLHLIINAVRNNHGTLAWFGNTNRPQHAAHDKRVLKKNVTVLEVYVCAIVIIKDKDLKGAASMCSWAPPPAHDENAQHTRESSEVLCMTAKELLDSAPQFWKVMKNAKMPEFIANFMKNAEQYIYQQPLARKNQLSIEMISKNRNDLVNSLGMPRNIVQMVNLNNLLGPRN